jgi:hypothetical protein
MPTPSRKPPTRDRAFRWTSRAGVRAPDWRLVARSRLAAALGALALVSCGLAQTASARTGSHSDQGVPFADPSSYSATLEQCVPASDHLERSLTVTGEIVGGTGTAKMGMRVELQQRTSDVEPFRTIVAPGLGVWRYSEPGVKIYKYVKQITNLAAPASYRAVVRFRWLGAHGRALKRAELRTATCEQPAPVSSGSTPTQLPAPAAR